MRDETLKPRGNPQEILFSSIQTKRHMPCSDSLVFMQGCSASFFFFF